MSVLERIFARKAQEVEAAKAAISFAEIRSRAKEQEPPRGFARALTNSKHPIALIAEVKKASPSRGVIRERFDPVEIAAAYETAGAEALSVLTDIDYFQGSPQNLILCRAATNLPCLRKDFIDDPYQVYEARAWGADAILLIVAALSDAALIELHGLAHELGMDVLVEVHSADEAGRALQANCPLIGVNNRNLGDFSTDLATSEGLIPMLCPSATVVAESAIESFGDVERMRAAGATAVLIGTRFCESPDIAAKVREVMGR